MFIELELPVIIIGKTLVSWHSFGEDVVIFPNMSWQRVAEVDNLWQKRQTDRMALSCPSSLPTIQDVTMKRVGFLMLEAVISSSKTKGSVTPQKSRISRVDLVV